MANFQNYLVSIFEDVNDTPIEPSATAPGNGSHLIQQYNNLVGSAESEINSISSNLNDLQLGLQGNWVVTEADYTVNGGEIIFVKNNQPIFPRVDNKLYVNENPSIGTTFSYMSGNQSLPIILKTYSDSALNVGTNTTVDVRSTAEFELYTLVFLGTGFNWKQVAGTSLTIEYGGGT